MFRLRCSRCGWETDDSANYCTNCGAEIEKYPRPAGFWIRFCAHFVDGLILIPIPILSFLNLLSFKNTALLILTVLPGFLYKPLMESFYGATLGKMACGIRVIDGFGQRLTLETAYIRYLPFLVSSLLATTQTLLLYMSPGFQSAKTFEEIERLQQTGPLDILVYLASFFLIADCIVAACAFRKRALHDMMADSYCVYKGPQSQQEQQNIYQSIQ